MPATTPIPWHQLLGTTPWEVLATLSAVVGVVLLARRNMLGWPLGIVWAGISAWLAWVEWQLVSDAILYASAIPVQCVCWFLWWRAPDRDHAIVRPQAWLGRRLWLWLCPAIALAICGWAMAIQALARNLEWVPEPDLLWRDSASTVLNYFAQFMQGARRMECWILWLGVNVLGIHIYSVKGLPIYAVQYSFFLGLGLYGWWCWQRALDPRPAINPS